MVIEGARGTDLAPLIVRRNGLTPRECSVTEQLARWRSFTQIASLLGLSRYTVADHVKAVYAKLGVKRRPELMSMLFTRTSFLRWRGER